jgi:hypothetical protein
LGKRFLHVGEITRFEFTAKCYFSINFESFLRRDLLRRGRHRIFVQEMLGLSWLRVELPWIIGGLATAIFEP